MVAGALLLALLTIPEARAQAPAPEIPPEKPLEPSGALFPVAPYRDTIEGYIARYSEEYGISAHELRTTLWCESRFNTKAVGDGGNSHGIAQIFLRYHPTVSKAEAQDPKFAIQWTAKKFSEGRAHLWTCWRIHFGNKTVGQ